MREFLPKNLNLDGSAILVTGGTGSFGRNFIETVVKEYKPRKVIVFSRDELKQYEMQQKFSGPEYDSLRYFIGDVRDRERLTMAMRDVDYVVHAAALKQVPAAEYNPMECVKTNILGAENAVSAALDARVKRVIALSTDKAANPVNLYGATKLASDKIFVAANNLSGSLPTRFAVVRYGNVVGSRGSVIPFFHKLISAKTDHLPITDERMTRFWITLQQGVNFVLSSLEMMQGGEIFIPRIPSMKITEVARIMGPGLPHKIVGIRPGEKLHEIMVTLDDARKTIRLDDRYIITPSFSFWRQDAYQQHGSQAMADGFSYASDNNEEWLDEAGLKKMLLATGMN